MDVREMLMAAHPDTVWLVEIRRSMQRRPALGCKDLARLSRMNEQLAAIDPNDRRVRWKRAIV